VAPPVLQCEDGNATGSVREKNKTRNEGSSSLFAFFPDQLKPQAYCADGSSLIFASARIAWLAGCPIYLFLPAVLYIHACFNLT
jgi:hypothetical protein